MKALPALLLVLAALCPLCMALAASMAPPASGPVAAVFPPWWDGTQAVTAAAQAGAVIRFGGLRFVVIVLAANRAPLRSRGAWLLLDPRAFGGCAAPIS